MESSRALTKLIECTLQVVCHVDNMNMRSTDNHSTEEEVQETLKTGKWTMSACNLLLDVFDLL